MISAKTSPVRVAVCACAVLLVSSCSRSETSNANNVQSDRDLPKAAENVIPKGYGTQDFLIHLDLQRLTEANNAERFYEQVLDRARMGAGKALLLTGGFQLQPTTSLAGVVRDGRGGLLPSIAVNFGLLSVQPGQSRRLLEQMRGYLAPGAGVSAKDLETASLLVELTTADLGRAADNVRADDVSDLDIGFVREIKVGDRLRSVFIFGQTLPPPDPSTEAGLSSYEVFASRWAAGRVQILGGPQGHVSIIVDEKAEVVAAQSIALATPKVSLASRTIRVTQAVVDPPPTFRRLVLKPEHAGLVVVSGGAACRSGWGFGALVGAGGGLPGVAVGSVLGCAFMVYVLVKGGPFVPGGALTVYNTVEDTCVPIKAGGSISIEFRDGTAHPRINDRPCARATGDIHMATFDGLRYEFHAAGEFVAAEDRARKVQIQIRLQPAAGSRGVSRGTAIAAKVDEATVAIHLRPQPRVYVNGKLVELGRGKGLSLGKTGWITFTGTSWIIGWPDGTVAWVRARRNLDLFVRPGPASGNLVGLFGNADGNANGDLVTRDGRVLPARISFKEKYGSFAESWRVSQAASLFHYDEGESTETFTDRRFPTEEVTVRSLDPAARAKAERACRDAGIVDPVALEECTFDLAVTGDASYISSAALVQFATHRATTLIPAGKDLGSLTVSGTGEDSYTVYDAAGQTHLVGRSWATNKAAELLPGTYTVLLNGSRQRVTVGAGQRATVQAGSLTVSGTGEDSYTVYDAAGQTHLVGRSWATNKAAELLPGTYTVLLNGSRQRVTVGAGQRATVQAGSLTVSGTGEDSYTVYDAAGQTHLVGRSWATNKAAELLPGTYTVLLNGSRQRVTVGAGQRATVQAGSLTVSGTGEDSYTVYDAAGQTHLVGRSWATNKAAELLPGTYTVLLNGSRQRVTVGAGQRATVQAGSLTVSGTGEDSYTVYDAAGQTHLVGRSWATNKAAELLPGTYTVLLNGSRQRVTVGAGQRATVQAGSLTVSGTGEDSYTVYDAAGQTHLVGRSWATNKAVELLPGQYVAKVGNRDFAAVVRAGQHTTIRR